MKLRILLHVKQHIDEHPERFCAANWAWAANVRDVLLHNAAPADFRCCIAGHILLLSGVFDETSLLKHSVSCDDGYLGRRARQILDVTEAQGRALFYPTQWAEPFRTAYYLAPNRFAETQAAAGYLYAFVQKAVAERRAEWQPGWAPDRTPAVLSQPAAIPSSEMR
jgi:hypothetical protein